MMVGKTKAQTLIEYSLLLVIFIAVLVAMQIYLKRSFQGHFKRNTDLISQGEQFSTALSNYTKVMRSSSKSRETVTPEGESRSELLEPELVVTEPYVDDFSNKKLTEEGLFQ